MRACDLMTAPVITVSSDTPVKDALNLLTTNRFTALPVVDDTELVGIVTEADLIQDRIPRDPRNQAVPGVVDARAVSADNGGSGR